MKRTRISESIIIPLPRQDIFDFTQDYKVRISWDTFLIRARLLDSDKAEKGAIAWCVLKCGMGMETKYVSYKRPRVTAVALSSRSIVFKKFAGSWNFKETTKKKTTVIFSYSYSLRIPFALLYPLFNLLLTSSIKNRLKDLKSILAQPNELRK